MRARAKRFRRERFHRGQRVWLVDRDGQQVSVVEGEVYYCDAPGEGEAVTVSVLGSASSPLVSVAIDQAFLSEQQARKKLFSGRSRDRR